MRRDRITVPVDLTQVARDSEREFPAPGSDIRPLVSLRAVPWLVVTYDELRKLPLDPRAAFVVSLLDGRCTVEMLLDLTGMPEDETLDVLRDLVRVGAIELRTVG